MRSRVLVRAVSLCAALHDPFSRLSFGGCASVLVADGRGVQGVVELLNKLKAGVAAEEDEVEKEWAAAEQNVHDEQERTSESLASLKTELVALSARVAKLTGEKKEAEHELAGEVAASVSDLETAKAEAEAECRSGLTGFRAAFNATEVSLRQIQRAKERLIAKRQAEGDRVAQAEAADREASAELLEEQRGEFLAMRRQGSKAEEDKAEKRLAKEKSFAEKWGTMFVTSFLQESTTNRKSKAKIKKPSKILQLLAELSEKLNEEKRERLEQENVR
eukprot:g16040.t1